MDILNFISWIKGKRQVNSVDPAKSLLPVALKDGRRDDDYLTGAISVEDFTAQVASVIPSGAQGPQGPQGVPGPVGPAGLNWQGAWSASGTYVVDDAVGYGGASWFCIANVGPTATTPNSDPTKWALLASQGATGAAGPQGIQGPQGPSGSGLPGTITGQTTYWTGTQWQPTFMLSTNPGTGALGTARVGIGATSLNTSGYPLRMYTNSAGIRIDQTIVGQGIGNWLQSGTVSFQWGLNPSSHPIPNSVYFTQNGANAIKFATLGLDRMIITGTGDVYVGATTVTNPEKLSVAGGNIFITDVGNGIVTYSPDGTKYKITVDNTGTVIATPYP